MTDRLRRRNGAREGEASAGHLFFTSMRPSSPEVERPFNGRYSTGPFRPQPSGSRRPRCPVTKRGEDPSRGSSSNRRKEGHGAPDPLPAAPRPGDDGGGGAPGGGPPPAPGPRGPRLSSPGLPGG